MSYLFPAGKILYAAIHAYKLEEYIKASTLLDKVLLINHNDFETILWKARTNVMLKKYQDAIDLIDSYNQKRINSELMKIAISWRTFCLDKINYIDTRKDITTLNKETDELLLRYQHCRQFDLVDLGKAILLLFAIIFVVIKLNISFQMRESVIAGLYACIITFYYYQRSILPSNYYSLFKYILDKGNKLLNSKRFRCTCLFILILQVLHFILQSPKITMFSENAVSAVILFPIFEEILFRGILYGYLRRYEMFISWAFVSILYYIFHLEIASFWHVVFSIVLLKSYEDEASIVAPILLHILNNGVIVGLMNLSLF